MTRVEVERARVEGWLAGLAAGVTAQPPRECFVPAEVPWRRVRARDVVCDYPDHEGDEHEHVEPDLWAVERSGWLAGYDDRERAWGLTIVSTTRHRVEADPDDRITVLVRCDLFDAVALTGEQLGARLIATRTSPDGTCDGDPAWRVDGGGSSGAATTAAGGP